MNTEERIKEIVLKMCRAEGSYQKAEEVLVKALTALPGTELYRVYAEFVGVEHVFDTDETNERARVSLKQEWDKLEKEAEKYLGPTVPIREEPVIVEETEIRSETASAPHVMFRTEIEKKERIEPPPSPKVAPLAEVLPQAEAKEEKRVYREESGPLEYGHSPGSWGFLAAAIILSFFAAGVGATLVSLVMRAG